MYNDYTGGLICHTTLYTYQDKKTDLRSCTAPNIMRQKNKVMSPVGPRTKNDCTSEGQQQST